MKQSDLKLGDDVRYRDKSYKLKVSNLGNKGFETVDENGIVSGSDDVSEYSRIIKKEIKDPTISEFIGKAERFSEGGGNHIWSKAPTHDGDIIVDVRVVEYVSEKFQNDLAQFVVDAINEKLDRMKQPTDNNRLRQIEMTTGKAKVLLVEKPSGARCVQFDITDGYLKFAGEDSHLPSIKLPNGNFKMLGIVGEAIDSPYADDICNKIVECFELAVGYRHYDKPAYLEYMTKTPVDSFKSLLKSYALHQNDVINWTILIEKSE